MRILLNILLVFFLLLYLCSVLYIAYQRKYFIGEGFGNLPLSAPEYLRQIKHFLCNIIQVSVWMAFIHLVLLIINFRTLNCTYKIISCFVILVYPLFYLSVGTWWICW